PAPAGASDLWSLYRESWHAVGVGTSTAAPPWLAVLAGLSTLALGQPWLVVAVIILGAVPLAGWTAYAAGSTVTRSRWLRACAAPRSSCCSRGAGRWRRIRRSCCAASASTTPSR